MLAKMTSKNRLTLPKAAVEAIGATAYFDVAVRDGQIVLTPVRIQRGDAVRAKLAALGLADADVAGAVRWVRAGAAPKALTKAAKPAAAPKAAKSRSAQPASRKKPVRRA
jgi:hypothetical protein